MNDGKARGMAMIRMRHGLGAALLAGAIALCAPALAQSTAISIGTGVDPDAPVEITSDSLELDQDSGRAVFVGTVEIVQGVLRLTAPRVEVSYSGAGGDIETMRATGGVTFTDGEEVAEGREAEYDPESGQLRMRGDVILTQGRNALAAEALDMDIETGNGVMTGRVRAILQRGAD